ncbi:MAG: aminopeptidase N [Vicingaceae bacterium]|jgi:aminopeptidase N
MKNLISKVTLLLFVLVQSSCYLKPFVKYGLNKEGFKKFSKKEKLAGNNENSQRSYKINRYDWAVELMPEKERISGNMKITFTPSVRQDTFMFDLQKRMKIESFTCNMADAKLKHKGDFLYLSFPTNMDFTSRISIDIHYKGKPVKMLGEGPIQWKKDDKGRHWISSITEGVGPHFMMPCSILLGKESDTTSISVTVPSNLTVTANGQLLGITEKDNKKTFNHLVTNSINIYNISFNAGHFVKVEKPYIDINGIERTIECYVMDYSEEIASEYYNQAPLIMKEFEQLFGEFPWWTDGCRFVESTFSAMEHQSCIAMGDDYRKNWKDTINTTLVHELAHEWWGNNVTGKDYCDIWIHEGMATYSEALFLEQFLGKEDYSRRIKGMLFSTANTIPIHKVCGVVYNSWTNGPDQDIYSKGGLMMHSLRVLVNDDRLFMNALKQIQVDFAKQNVYSEEMVNKLNELLLDDYSPMLNWYLDEAKPPQLEIKLDRTKGKLQYKWAKEIPLMMRQELLLLINDEETRLNPTIQYQTIDVVPGQKLNFLIERGIYYQLNVLEIKE